MQARLFCACASPCAAASPHSRAASHGSNSTISPRECHEPSRFCARGSPNVTRKRNRVTYSPCFGVGARQKLPKSFSFPRRQWATNRSGRRKRRNFLIERGQKKRHRYRARSCALCRPISTFAAVACGTTCTALRRSMPRNLHVCYSFLCADTRARAPQDRFRAETRPKRIASASRTGAEACISDSLFDTQPFSTLRLRYSRFYTQPISTARLRYTNVGSPRPLLWRSLSSSPARTRRGSATAPRESY